MTDSGTVPHDAPVGLGGRSPMADPPAAGPAGVAMSGPGVLLATKLHVLRPPPGFVPRRRLVDALGEGLAKGRVLVSAPAGFGKTALLADWARGGGRPGHMQLGRQQDTRPGHGDPRRARRRPVSRR